MEAGGDALRGPRGLMAARYEVEGDREGDAAAADEQNRLELVARLKLARGWEGRGL